MRRCLTTLSLVLTFHTATAQQQPVEIKPMRDETAVAIESSQNYTGSCGKALIRVLGVQETRNNFFAMDQDAGQIIVRHDITKQLVLSINNGLLSDYNGVACVPSSDGEQLLVWSNCGGTACRGDFQFLVINPDTLSFVAPKDPKRGQCNEKCASKALGNEFPQQVNIRFNNPPN